MTENTNKELTLSEKKALVENTLGINLLPDTKLHTNRMEIPNQDGNDKYTIAQQNHARLMGRWSCGCQDWIYRNHGQVYFCKHLKPLKSLLNKISIALTGQQIQYLNSLDHKCVNQLPLPKGFEAKQIEEKSTVKEDPYKKAKEFLYGGVNA